MSKTWTVIDLTVIIKINNGEATPLDVTRVPLQVGVDGDLSWKSQAYVAQFV